MKGHLSFIAGLWMTIVVALLSALAPLGPPSSRVTGSAFNPATTSVVLKARSPRAMDEARQADVGPDRRISSATPAHLLFLIVLPLIVVGLIRLAASSGQILHNTPVHTVFLRGRRARGPPVSF